MAIKQERSIRELLMNYRVKLQKGRLKYEREAKKKRLIASGINKERRCGKKKEKLQKEGKMGTLNIVLKSGWHLDRQKEMAPNPVLEILSV